jgi:hypothetical protein
MFLYPTNRKEILVFTCCFSFDSLETKTFGQFNRSPQQIGGQTSFPVSNKLKKRSQTTLSVLDTVRFWLLANHETDEKGEKLGKNRHIM